jgi:two-component system CheB/CheR fusion protein
MGMLTAAEVLEQGALDQDRAVRAAAVIARQTHHMARLLDDLLDITRLQHGGMQLRTAPLDLRLIIDVVLDEIASRLAAGGQRLNVDVPEDEVIIVGDATRLRQLLANLLTNAIKYTPTGNSIYVSIETKGEVATLRVRDEGVGMPPDTLEQAFEPFVRFSEREGADESGGLGLGLAVVRAIAQAHGGDVQALSQGIGAGTEFIVTLPRRTASSVRGDGGSRLPRADRNTLLLVEDQEDNLELLEMALSERGYEVIPASTAEQAIERFKESPTAIAVIDIGLPDGSGCSDARQIRELAGDAPLLIALTGYGQQSDRDEIMASGFDHHLIKPASVAMVCDLIEDESESS